MLHVLRQTATFMAVASLFLSARALPSVVNNEVRDSDAPSVYVHPGFVPSNSKAPTSSLQARFDANFKGTDNQQFTCQSQSVKSEPIQGARISDCQDAMDDLLKMPGYWDCSKWVKDQNYVYFDLFSKGSCHVSVVAHSDSPAQIGNGDVYAWVYKTISDYAYEDTAAAHGTVQCGDVKIEWSISGTQGSTG